MNVGLGLCTVQNTEMMEILTIGFISLVYSLLFLEELRAANWFKFEYFFF